MEEGNPYTTVFISHANPEDNYFAAWLTAKLELTGYEVWCDLSDLTGAEDFWEDIQNKIRNSTVKFIFVCSSSAFQQRRGTMSELAVAARVKDRQDLIIPIRLDDTPFSEFPIELIRLNTIDFSKNWAKGLESLQKKLTEDETPKQLGDSFNSIIKNWQNNLSVSDSVLDNVQEEYWTNWFEIKLPDQIYVHTLKNPNDFDESLFQYPVVRDKHHLVSFSCGNCLSSSAQIIQGLPILTSKVLEERNHKVKVSGAMIHDINRIVIQLLNDAIERFLISRGLQEYSLTASSCFYFPKVNAKYPRVDMRDFGRRSSQLAGKKKSLDYHFAVEFNAFLYPVPAYFLTYHVVFTSEGLPVGKKVQHTKRRSLRWYNKKWRDLVLGSIQYLKSHKDHDRLYFPVCSHQNIEFNTKPMKLISDIGYREPGLSNE